MKKKCSCCKEYKNISEFNKNKSTKDGLQYHCTGCRKEYRNTNKIKIAMSRKRYYKNNKEKVQANNLRYRKVHIKDKKQYDIKYRETNKEIIAERKKKYFKENKNSIDNQYKQYRKNNKDRISNVTKQYRNANAKYATYYKQLTVDEAPVLSSDGVLLEVKCKYCSRYFIPKNNQVAARVSSLNGSSLGVNYLYCSDNCKESCPIFKQNKYPKGFKQASSREVNPLVRQMCFERDSWKCQICGGTQEDAPLHCHHIEGYTQNPRLGNDVANTITLCKTCHKEVHKLPGCNYHQLRCDRD